jgi:hypothetical protein
MLRSLSKSAFVVSQSKALSQQVFDYPADPCFVDGFSIEPGYVIQCREAKRDIPLCAIVKWVLDFLHLISQIPKLLLTSQFFGQNFNDITYITLTSGIIMRK